MIIPGCIWCKHSIGDPIFGEDLKCTLTNEVVSTTKIACKDFVYSRIIEIKSE